MPTTFAAVCLIIGFLTLIVGLARHRSGDMTASALVLVGAFLFTLGVMRY